MSRGGWVVARTLVELNGIAPDSETDGGVVLTGTGAGYYERQNSAWVFGRGFPDTFARVELAGTGTAQTGAVATGVVPANVEVFFAFVGTPNSGPLRLSIGGEPPREVINFAGAALAPGEWTGTVMFARDGQRYRLLLDAGTLQATALLVEQAKQEADRAHEEADRAERAVADANAMIVPDGAVTTPKMADGAVTTPKLADGAVTFPKNADVSVDPSAAFEERELVSWLTYHKSRSSWHVRSFGQTRSEVGSGGDDSGALQAAVDSQEIIDIAGVVLRVSDTIIVDYPGANIGSSILAQRVGNIASSKIIVTDNALPILFDCASTNFEAYGFKIEPNSANSTTLGFQFKRPDGSPSDIDASLVDISMEYGGKLFHIYGRGLKVSGAVLGNLPVLGDIDWPTDWTPNGQSNDLQETGMRAYHFSNLRMHGTGPLRNIGPNARNCRGIVMDNVLLDIGGAAFEGVAINSIFSNVVQNIAANIASVLFNLYGGSEFSDFIGFKAGGFKSPNVTRLPRNAININPTADAPVKELHFIGGSIGPINRNGVSIFGSGTARNILFQGVSFDRTNIEGSPYTPIAIFDSSGAITEASVKLSACNFEFGGEAAPAMIVGGNNSSAITVYRDVLTTRLAGIPWAQPNVNVVA